MASHGRPSPTLLYAKGQVKGGWLATPYTSLDQPLHDNSCIENVNASIVWCRR